MYDGYDEISKRVNEGYTKTEDISKTMKDTGVSFDVVFEMIGFKDELDYM